MAHASNGHNSWSARFPVYQIDFTAVSSGKRVATSKRRIRWRFGFSNQEALDAGDSGTACRGEEHDVTVVWSVTSGKRLVLADGQEVHYSNERAGTFEFSWTMRGNHVLKVLCHATPQMSQVTGNNGFRQYDLSVDGQSFFSMPKVYELGIRGPVSHSRVPKVIAPQNKHNNHQPGAQAYFEYKDQYNSTYNTQTDTTREEEDLRRAIQNSINESRAHLERNSAPPAAATRAPPPPVPAPAPVPVPSADLIDMTALTISNNPTQPYAGLVGQQASIPKVARQHSAPNQYYNTNVGVSAPPPSFSDIYSATQPQQVPTIPQNTNIYGMAQNQNWNRSTSAPATAPMPALTAAPATAPVYALTAAPATAHVPALTGAPATAPMPALTAAPPTAQVPALTAAPRSTQMVQGNAVQRLVNVNNLNSTAQYGSALTNAFAGNSNQGAMVSSNNGPQPSLSQMQMTKPTSNQQAMMAPAPQTGYNQQLATHNQYQVANTGSNALAPQQNYGYNQYQQGYAMQQAHPASYGAQQQQYQQLQYPQQQRPSN